MARTVTLTFDDGSSHVYQNVPDEVTPDQVQSRANKDFAGKKLKSIDGGKGKPSTPSGTDPVLYNAPVPDPNKPTKPAEKPRERSFVDKLIGGGEAAVSTLTAIPAGVAGAAAGTAEALKPSNYGTQAGVQRSSDRAADVAGKFTYQPRTQAGREYAGKIGDVAQNLQGLPPDLALQIPRQGMGFAPPPMMKPRISDDARLLADKGVTMTPGQLMGGATKRAEEGLQSVPIVGDTIKAAKGRGVEQFNAAAVDDALQVIGQKLPKGSKGNEALAHARTAFSDAYDDALGKMKGRLDAAQPEVPQLGAPGMPAPPPAPSLRGELEQLRGNIRNSTLPPDKQRELERVMDNQIIAKFTPDGLASGETLKNIQSTLRSLAKTQGRSENPDVREMGLAVTEMNAALRRMLDRENPEQAPILAKIDDGYGRFKIAQRAAASTSSDKGQFTPTQYMSSVKAKDPTKDKRAFSEGTAKQQELAQAAKGVLPDRLPDSGTPYRLLLIEAMLGLGSHQYGLEGIAGGIAAGIAFQALYSDPALRMIQRMMLGKGTAPVRRVAQAASPIVAPTAAQFPQPPQQQ